DLGQPADRLDRLLDAPGLICIERQSVLAADRLTDEPSPPEVAFEIAADLYLQGCEAGVDRLARPLRQRFLRISEPARRGRVRGKAIGEKQLLALGLRRRVAAEERERLVRGERVVDVAKVDAGNDLLGRQVGEQLPERLALELRVEVPDGIDDRRRG